jgi:DNA invertase Pin-like site-specific DNA recombinase
VTKGIAYCYARVSTAMQAEEGVSLDAQEKQLIFAAESQGYTVQMLREEGKSGKNIKGRPVLRKALEDLDAGKAEALFVTRLDRLARSTRDFLDIVDRSHKHNWRLALLDLGLDTATYQGRFVVTIMSAMAEMERGMISMRQKDIHEDRRSSGKRWGVDLGPLPLVSSDIKERIVKERTLGLSYKEIADNLNKDLVPTVLSGKKWYASTVREIYIRVL